MEEKRGRGRPRKTEISEANDEKRRRGRPFGSVKKRGRGRPKKGQEPRKPKEIKMPKLPVKPIENFNPKNVSTELTRHKIEKEKIDRIDVPEYIRSDVHIKTREPHSANYKPGQSGNGAGRPRGVVNRSTTVLQWLKVEVTSKNPLTGRQEKLSVQDLVTLSLINQAMKGNVHAYKELMDSAYGKAVQPVEIDLEATALSNDRKKKIVFVKKT